MKFTGYTLIGIGAISFFYLAFTFPGAGSVGFVIGYFAIPLLMLFCGALVIIIKTKKNKTTP